MTCLVHKIRLNDLQLTFESQQGHMSWGKLKYALIRKSTIYLINLLEAMWSWFDISSQSQSQNYFIVPYTFLHIYQLEIQ